jgi:hypothetical protein
LPRSCATATMCRLQMAEVAIPRHLFVDNLRLIGTAAGIVVRGGFDASQGVYGVQLEEFIATQPLSMC